VDPHEHLVAQYEQARRERPGDHIEDIVALVADRMGPEAEIELAEPTLATAGVDVIRHFVYSMEED
jgi:hypothetical protein